MSIPKFTSKAVLGNYGDYSYVKRKYKYECDSIKIEPAMQEWCSECWRQQCRTQQCRYRCGFTPGEGIEWCEGAREVCDYVCNCCNDDFCYTAKKGTVSTSCVPEGGA